MRSIQLHRDSRQTGGAERGFPVRHEMTRAGRNRLRSHPLLASVRHPPCWRRKEAPMDTAAVAGERRAVDEPGLVWGSWLMIIAAIGFVGYAILFFIRDLSGGFLELGIGPNEVNVGKGQIEQFSPSLYAYISHLQIALSGFIAAVG